MSGPYGVDEAAITLRTDEHKGLLMAVRQKEDFGFRFFSKHNGISATADDFSVTNHPPLIALILGEGCSNRAWYQGLA